MDEHELLAISKEIQGDVRRFIEENEEDCGEIIGKRVSDVTRRIDMFAERALERALERRGICAHIISEELGDHVFPEDCKPECTLIFDPIDGSSNAATGIPFFCSSIAYSPKTDNVSFDDIEIGVIATIFGRIYHAVKGVGKAFVDGKEMPRPMKGKDKAIVSIYSYGRRIPNPLIKKLFEMQYAERFLVRVLGSIAVEMCYVAEGVMDAVVDLRGSLNGYDIASALLILRETGGIATDVYGNNVSGEVAKTISIPIIAARKKEMHDKIIDYIRSALPSSEFER